MKKSINMLLDRIMIYRFMQGINGTINKDYAKSRYRRLQFLSINYEIIIESMLRQQGLDIFKEIDLKDLKNFNFYR